MASERSLSPPETRVRLVYVLDAALPPPLVNHQVIDLAGRHLATPDLLDAEVGHVVEYDGADHRSRARHAVDVDRESGLRSAGCEVTTVVAPHLRRPDRMVERLLADRARAVGRRDEPVAWRLGHPGRSLDERIAEREDREAWWWQQQR